MKVVLYNTQFSKPFSVLCTLVTAYPLSHAAIIQDNVLYDTTATTGKFQEAEVKYPERMVTVYDFPEIDATEFIKSYYGNGYDYLGLITYPLKLIKSNLGNMKDRMYCFEVVAKLLARNNYPEFTPGDHISGREIVRILMKNYDMVGERMSIGQLTERYLTKN